MRCLVPSWNETGMGWDQDGTKFFFMGWDETKSLWDESSRSHAKPGPGPGWDKTLVGWELPSWSRGQPKFSLNYTNSEILNEFTLADCKSRYVDEHLYVSSYDLISLKDFMKTVAFSIESD